MTAPDRVTVYINDQGLIALLRGEALAWQSQDGTRQVMVMLASDVQIDRTISELAAHAVNDVLWRGREMTAGRKPRDEHQARIDEHQARIDAHVIAMLRQVAAAIEAGRDGEPVTLINTGRVNLLNYAADRLEALTRGTGKTPDSDAGG